jgi:hypothetical protein
MRGSGQLKRAQGDAMTLRITCQVVALGCAIFQAAVAHADPESYLCTPDHSVGLHYDKTSKSWVPQQFASSEKYIVRPLKSDETTTWQRDIPEPKCIDIKAVHCVIATYGVFNLADKSKTPSALCVERDFWGDASSLDFVCKEIVFTEFAMDWQSKRFEIYYSGGYLGQPFFEANPTVPNAQLPPDDVFVEIGNCSAF